MFKLLIVEDEEKIREGLKKFINWAALDIDAIETAVNGLEALESVKLQKPDIILCDIRMPKMDGIEFSKRLKELFPACKLIFLSGYADKEYLKAAIQLNAVDYIEKPVNLEEVTSVVRLAIDRLKEENARNRDLEKVQKSLTDNLHLIRQEAALALIRPDQEVSHITEKYGPNVLHIPPNAVFAVYCINIYWSPLQTFEQKNCFKDMLLRQVNSDSFDELNNLPTDRLLGFLDDDCVLLITFANTSSILEQDNWLESLLDFLLKASAGAFAVSIGCGQSTSNAYTIPESFKSARMQASQAFYTGVNRIYHSSPTQIVKSLIDNKDILIHFKSLIKRDQFEQAEKYISEWTEKLRQGRNHDIASARKLYLDLMLLLYDQIWENERMQPDEPEKVDILEEANWSFTLEELCALVIKYIRSLATQPDDPSTYKRKIYDIMKLVRDKYGKTNLTIKDIADQAYFTQTYLCAFFKKYTGKTLNQYITEVRMEKAKELLRDKNLKLYEIATMVGYSDPHYFSQLFKKQYGCMPSEYRERT